MCNALFICYLLCGLCRRGLHKDPDFIICHELLHVRTGLTDATHEAWICDVAAALVALKRRAGTYDYAATLARLS
jgi:hypothetical protein